MANTKKTEIINNGTKKIFAPNEVESFIESGWDFFWKVMRS